MTADERANEQLEHIRVGRLLDEARAENERLRRAMQRIIDWQTFGSPYGEAGLNGAVAHHQNIVAVLDSALSAPPAQHMYVSNGWTRCITCGKEPEDASHKDRP